PNGGQDRSQREASHGKDYEAHRCPGGCGPPGPPLKCRTAEVGNCSSQQGRGERGYPEHSPREYADVDHWHSPADRVRENCHHKAREKAHDGPKRGLPSRPAGLRPVPAPKDQDSRNTHKYDRKVDDPGHVYQVEEWPVIIHVLGVEKDVAFTIRPVL